MARGWGVLAALLLLLAGAAMAPARAEEQPPEPGFRLELGGQGSLRVMDDGSFSLFDGESELASGARWSVRVAADIIAPGTDAYRSALVAPLHRAGDTLTMLFYEDGIATEIAYRAAGTSAVLSVTTVNRWPESVNVTFRCAFGLRDIELSSSLTGPLRNETELALGDFGRLSGWLAGTERFSCLLPESPRAVDVVSPARAALESAWDVKVTGSRPLGPEKGVAVFWPQRTLGPGDFARATLVLAAGAEGSVAFRQDDLRIDGFAVNPASAYDGERRRVLFGVFNGGPAARFDATLIYMREGVPHSMVFLPLRPGWNQTVWSELEWAPVSAGNYTVVLVLPMFADRDPSDNLRTAAATVEVNPFRFTMKFSTSDVVSSYKSYPGARFKVQMYIYNTGFSPDAYNISVRGVPDGWTVLLSNNNVSIEPDRIAYIWLTVQPSYEAPNGTYSFNIVGRSYATGERQSLVETVEIGPPPPPGTGYTPPGYSELHPGNGTVPPPSAIRPYPPPDASAVGWIAGGDRTRLAFSALSILGLVTAVMLLGAAIYQASRQHTISVLRRIIKRALYGLLTGDEYRLIIFDAYRKMCAHLERLGFTREDHVTPTEFARALRLALPLDTASIRMLTGLFEEARYSDHSLGEPDRKAAIESLRHIDAELDRLTTFIEEEPRLVRLRRRMGFGEA